MSNRGELDGKVAIVTGAGAGIGFETARTLAQNGAKVVIAARTLKAVAEVAERLRGEGLDVTHHAADIADENSVKSLVEFTVKHYGKLDVLDNNAAHTGIAGDGMIASMDVETWDTVMSINARGTMLMCKHAIPAMIAAGGGSIINISSGTSMAGDFQATAYAASKGAINTLTKYIATQYGAQNVRCNAIIVGLVSTETLEATLPPPIRDIFSANKLMGRLGRPRDIAEMVSFLGSDRSSWITGQLMPVDGGFYAHTPTTVPVAQLIASMHGPT